MKEVIFLGHKLNRDGVKPAEQNVQAISNWPVPTNVKEVQVFLGVVGWYRKFIMDFSTVARPLRRLLEKEANFQWEKSEEESFKTLKRVTTAPVLAHPNLNHPFLVTSKIPSNMGIHIWNFCGLEFNLINFATGSRGQKVEAFFAFLRQNARFELIVRGSGVDTLLISVISTIKINQTLHMFMFYYTDFLWKRKTSLTVCDPGSGNKYTV